jgi:hypothetical protein
MLKEIIITKEDVDFALLLFILLFIIYYLLLLSLFIIIIIIRTKRKTGKDYVLLEMTLKLFWPLRSKNLLLAKFINIILKIYKTRIESES